MDNEKNTPLHVIVRYPKAVRYVEINIIQVYIDTDLVILQYFFSDFATLHTIIVALIDAGAHMDTVNIRGQTPYDSVITGKFTNFIIDLRISFLFSCDLFGRYSISISGVAKIILRTQTNLSLTCMAAKAIKTYDLPYRGNVPQSLESFIELHGSNNS